MAAKKSLYERAKEWIAVVMKKPKAPTVGVWFNTNKKKGGRTLPTKEELQEFLAVAAPVLQDALAARNVPIGDMDNGINIESMGFSTAQCLYDWLSYSGPIGSRRDTLRTVASESWGNVTVKKEDDRIAKKPIEVRKELEGEPNPWTLEGLDDKIALLKRKGAITTQHYSKAELDSLIERLENRKKYEQYKDFFTQFPNTTDVLIDQLLTKYKLEMKGSDLFVPEFPKEAIDVMEAYTKKVKELCGKAPVYYVIAEEGDFKKKYEKRDPILLVQSPFGFYYSILGAWDEELILLSEL